MLKSRNLVFHHKFLNKNIFRCIHRTHFSHSHSSTCNHNRNPDSTESSSNDSATDRNDNLSKTFHKRPLPSTLIAFSSLEGKRLFKEAMETGGMQSFFPLSEQFVTQSDPSYCSLSSLAMVLNALNFDPKKTWKGIWRWVSEETLQCDSKSVCGHSLDRVKESGMIFADFELLARCHGVNIQSYRAMSIDNDTVQKEIGLLSKAARDKSIESTPKSIELPHSYDCVNNSYNIFRSKVVETSYSDKAQTFIVTNFSRKALGQTGDGHYSPIGGYHAERDLVLILDVARFKYPPYWVPLDLLWEAMAASDKATGMPRGFFVISSWESKQVNISNGQPFDQVANNIQLANYDRKRENSLARTGSAIQDLNLSESIYSDDTGSIVETKEESKISNALAGEDCPPVIRTWALIKKPTDLNSCCINYGKIPSG